MKKDIKKVLIINIFGIGDVLFTTPVIRNIKESIPQVTVGYMANQRTVRILENNPLVDRVHVYERDFFQEIWGRSKKEYFQAMARSLNEIRNEKYDVVLDLSLNGNAAFLMWLVGTTERIGDDFRGRSPFLSRKIPFKGYEGKHVVAYYLDLLKELGLSTKYRKLEIYSSPEDERWADDFCKENDFSKDRKVVAVFPGGGASWGKDARFKRWPAAKYAQLINKMIDKLSCEVIIFGDEKEQDICSDIASAVANKTNSVCGKTTLGQTIALLGKCSMAVVNDGGPLHMAVAKGVPTVSIFGPVDSEVYGPYPKDEHLVVTYDVSCRPCYRQFRKASCDHITCLKNIDVNDVFGNIEQVYINLKEN